MVCDVTLYYAVPFYDKYGVLVWCMCTWWRALEWFFWIT